MSTAAAPSIPPRPTRSQNQDAAAEPIPKIPPRPIRNIKRDLSPERESFARSPLHEGGFMVPPGSSGRRGSQDLPPRPPSVSMPSIGNEGDEYGTVVEALSRTTSHDPSSRPHVLQSVGSDIQLHAPKPTLPPSSAKAQTAAVTNVDTPGANAAINHPDEKEYLYRSVTKRSSFSSHHSATSELRRSIYADDSEQELGIPEIGMRVPMSPFAGDVQAPTAPPSGPPPFSKPTSAQGGRHHGRTPSGREFYGPPGSYGLHGHGVQAQSKFERAWHEKHPDAAEHGHYAPSAVLPRSEYVLSSEDLNRVVRSTRDTVNDVGTPDEQIGYMASEEYAQRIASRASSTRPASIKDGGSQPMSPVGRQTSNISPDEDDDEVIHIAPTPHHASKYERPDDSVENLAGSDEAGLHDENGYEAPILASDEIEAGQGYLLPAVPPSADRREEFESRNSSRPVSRTGSRPGSMSGGQAGPAKNLFYGYEEDHGTPLEDVDEHEPLFPEEEDAAESKRPGAQTSSSGASIRSKRRTFPSKDIWEDAPDSAKLEASVDELPDEPTQDELEMERRLSKGAVDRANDFEGEEAGSFLSSHTKDFARVKGTDRPSMKQRFPSKDIWEDSPESYHLQTEVATKEGEDLEADPYNDVSTRPVPVVPARPVKSSNVSPVDSKAAPPAISSRPKPTVPARPRHDSGDSAGAGSNLSRQTSGESDSSETRVPPPIKPKSTRVGGKIASLQAGFLDNLNATLGRGPVPKPKPAEPEKKEETLSDARKGRARGPSRRPKEVKGLDENNQTPTLVKIGGCSFMMPVTIWEVEGESGAVNVTKDSKPKEDPGHEGKTALADETAADTVPDKKLDTAEKVPESKSQEAEYPSKSTEPGPDAETVKIAEQKEDLHVGEEAPESGMPGKEDAEEKDDKILG